MGKTIEEIYAKQTAFTKERALALGNRNMRLEVANQCLTWGLMVSSGTPVSMLPYLIALWWSGGGGDGNAVATCFCERMVFFLSVHVYGQWLAMGMVSFCVDFCHLVRFGLDLFGPFYGIFSIMEY